MDGEFIMRYNVVTSETKATFAKHPGLSISGILGITNSLAYSPDGGTIATGDRGGSVPT